MSEKRFLGFVLTEGMLLTLLGLCVLILPKITSLSFGVMLSSAFIVYGIYKIVGGFIGRNFLNNFFMNLILGIYITTIGILLLLVPRINLLWLIALIGVYFLLESLSATAFAYRIRNVFNIWGCKLFAAFVLFAAGFLIILGLPSMSFWTVAVLSGICFLIKGMSKLALFISNTGNYNV